MASWIRAAAAGAVLLLALGGAPRAEEAPAAPSGLLDRVIAAHQLRVGLTGDYRPYSLQDAATGAFSGIDVDLTAGLARALGAEPVYVKTSWPTLMADFAAGRFDVLAGGVSVTLDRQRIGFFSVPTDLDGKAAVARCADAAKYDGLDAIDRPGVRVVVNPGGTNERFDRAHLHSADIRVFPDNKLIFREVAEGRADVMITDGVEGRLQHKLDPTLCAIHPERPFDRSEKAWLLPRDIAFKLFVDQYIHQRQIDGGYAETVRRWLD